MEALLDPLQYAILPVFAFPALGFYLGLKRVFSVDAARGANQYVMEISVPAIVFTMLARAELGDIDWPVIGVYIGSELVLYAWGYAMARSWFKRGRRESILLAIACAFPNHVFFTLPIAEDLYGHDVALRMGTMIAADILVLFAGSIMLLELISGQNGPVRAVAGLAKNRMLLAMAAGLVFNLSGLELHDGVTRFLALAAASGAPPSLFALGVILANGDLARGWAPARVATFVRIIVAPLIGWILLGDVVPADPEMIKIALLAYGAPCAATGFMLGLHYQIPVHSTAKAIIMSTALSVFTIALIV